MQAKAQGALDHFGFNAISSPQAAGTSFTITVTAQDSSDATITDYTGMVNFTSTDSQAVLPSNYTFVPGDDGTHSFSVTLVTASSQSITVTDSAAGISSTTDPIMVDAASASYFVVSGFPSSTTAGVSGSVTVTAYDAYGDVATGYAGMVQFASSDGQAVLPADSTLSSGTGTFSVTLVTAGSQSITVTDTSDSSVTGSLAVTVVANVATQLVVTSSSGTVTAGVPFTVLVRALNADGGTATSYVGTVVFTSSDLGFGVSLPSSYTFTAEAAGEASFSAVLVTASSNASITVFDGTLTASDTGITVVHGSAVSVVVSPASDSITAGSSDTFTALATDAYGNSWDDTGLVAWSINTASGTFTANSVLVTGAGGWTVTATDPDSVYGTASLTVTPAGLDQFVFSTVGTQTAGSFSITITAEDQYGNTATSYTGTPSLSDLSGTISPTSTSAFVGGVWTGSVTVTLAGSDFINATDGAITETSNTFTVTHASAVSIAVSPATDSITAGNPEIYTSTATDAYGNTWDVTSLTTWSISSGAGGSWSNNVYTSATAGPWTVTGTYETMTATAQLTVNAATYQITVISAYGNPTASASVNAGDSFTASVTSPESAGVGQQWICIGYSIDGGLVVSGTSYTFNDVQASHTITFNWQEQYYLTTSTNFGSAGPVSGWYDVGSTVTLSATAPSVGLGEQYVWNGWTGTGTGSYSGNDNPSTNAVTMNGPITETASWTHQYELTVTSAYGSTSGQGWYNAGVSVPFSVNTPVSGGTGVQYALTSWSGSGTGAYSGSSSSSSVTMNNPITEMANWQTQYQVTFAVSGGGSTIPTGSNVWENAGSLPITATPNSGCTFSSWSSNTGSITFNNANSASATATIGGTGTITATFAITASPTPLVSSPSPTPKGSSPSPTPLVSTPSPTPLVSSPSATPKGSSPSSTPLYVVLVAVIIVASIILISAGITINRSRRKINITLSNPETST